MYSKQMFVFIVVCFLTGSAHGQRDEKFFRQDYTYIDAVGSFYKIHRAEQTWFDAKQVCAQEGASLYYPENSNEAHTIFQTETGPWFGGMSDLFAQGVYETVDGKSVSDVYNNWLSHEPNNVGGTQNCVLMFKNAEGAIYIYLGSCTDKHPFICKKNQQYNHSCHMFNLDYTFNSDTGNCYKLHTTPLTWTDAHAACRAERAYLAVINNQLEADYLANLTKSAFNQRDGGNYYRGIYHLGFHSRFHEGWQTVTGTPMNVECDTWWDNHEPIPDEHNQCGSMFFNGRLNAVSCDTKSFFICEHEEANSTLFVG